jgi:predicted phosphodiesterase
LRTPVVELTTVADDHAVVHVGAEVRVHDGLEPDTVYEFDGVTFRTLPRFGERLATVATVNDVHFGEVECGILGGLDSPTMRVPDGAEPYPVMMNRGAIAEIRNIRPDTVIVKGDLTSDGLVEQYDEFLQSYGQAFGDRLHHIRGNHDEHQMGAFAPTGPFEVVVPGARLAIIDTTCAGAAGGSIAADQLDWLDELAARSDLPVLVFGHHHIWRADHDADSEVFFGIAPRDAERLIDVVARRRSIVGYFAGHTHRNRVVHLPETGDVPWVEVACVKDFPGSWAEYRVFDGGITQVHHRVSTPEALAWTEKTRDLYQPFDYVDYAFGSLDDRCFALPSR